MIAVLAGGTGLVGSALLARLLEDASVERIISVARRPWGTSHAKLSEVLVPSLADLEKHGDKLRGDVYFCCLGTTIKAAGSQGAFRAVDHDAVVAFGRIARRHGARCFTLVSATGADPGSSIFYNRVKGETERDLAALGLARLVIFQPSLLIGDRKESRPAERFFVGLARGLAPVTPPFLRKRAMTNVGDLAARLHREGTSTAPGRVTVAATEI